MTLQKKFHVKNTGIANSKIIKLGMLIYHGLTLMETLAVKQHQISM